MSKLVCRYFCLLYESQEYKLPANRLSSISFTSTVEQLTSKLKIKIMKLLALNCFLLFALVMSVTNAQNSKLENFDIDMLLKNDRILTNYLKCLLDKGPCTSEV